MALVQATTPVTTTQIANNTLALWIDKYVRLAPRAPKVGLFIVFLDTAGRGQNSYVKAINERSRLTGVAVVAQNDAAPEARATLTQSTITGGRRGLRTFILNQANLVSIENEFAVNAGQLVEAHDQYWHEQVLGLFTSVTATSGTNATNHTLQNWDTVTAAFRNDNHAPGALWAVKNPDAIRDLRVDLRTNAAALFGTAFGEAEARAALNNQSGLGVMFDGYTMYESAATPAGDTTGWTNCLGVNAGPDSAFEIDSYEEASIVVQPDQSRFGQWQVIGSIAGVGIARQSSARAFVTRT
jgi:hypothetical protein